MIDEKYQGNHYAENAMTIAIDILKKEYGVSKINLGHRKVNIAAARLYEKLGFYNSNSDILQSKKGGKS